MSPRPHANEPVLVTGMPRSGTTWLARLLASAPGTALTGREPMNPRGRQYALGGTLSRWVRLEALTPRQRRSLRTSYSGSNPRVYSRYGHHQWAAPLPWTRIIVKDPFAMLSMLAIHEETNARAVLLFRHPGAALTSYRRMGWTPDVGELSPIVERVLATRGPIAGVEPEPLGSGEIDRMAWFWNALYGIALGDADRLGDSVLVLAHEDIAGSGVSFGKSVFNRLNLGWAEHIAGQFVRDDASGPINDAALHNFDRDPSTVAHEWEARVAPEERQQLEKATNTIYTALQQRSFRPRI